MLDPSQTVPSADADAVAADDGDFPLAGLSQQELEKIAMLLEETDELNESVE